MIHIQRWKEFHAEHSQRTFLNSGIFRRMPVATPGRTPSRTHLEYNSTNPVQSLVDTTYPNFLHRCFDQDQQDLPPPEILDAYTRKKLRETLRHWDRILEMHGRQGKVRLRRRNSCYTTSVASSFDISPILLWVGLRHTWFDVQRRRAE